MEERVETINTLNYGVVSDKICAYRVIIYIALGELAWVYFTKATIMLNPHYFK